MPGGTLVGEGVRTASRSAGSAGDLHSIVGLPKGVFAPNTGIKTDVLFE